MLLVVRQGGMGEGTVQAGSERWCKREGHGEGGGVGEWCNTGRGGQQQ